jgi:hypothetical protein
MVGDWTPPCFRRKPDRTAAATSGIRVLIKEVNTIGIEQQSTAFEAVDLAALFQMTGWIIDSASTLSFGLNFLIFMTSFWG